MAFTLKQKRLILKRQNGRCAIDGRLIALDAPTLREWKKTLGHFPDKNFPYAVQAKFHHKKWRAKGGTDATSNGIALCGYCHTHKAHTPFSKGSQCTRSIDFLVAETCKLSLCLRSHFSFSIGLKRLVVSLFCCIERFLGFSVWLKVLHTTALGKLLSILRSFNVPFIMFRSI
jgi:hypothetical protein